MLGGLLESLYLVTALNPITTNIKEIPKRDLPQYIVDHLDVTSFQSSLGPKKDDKKRTLKDYGFKVDDRNEKKIVLKDADDAQFSFKVLEQTETSVVLCLDDRTANRTPRTHNPKAVTFTEDKEGYLMADEKTSRRHCPTTR